MFEKKYFISSNFSLLSFGKNKIKTNKQNKNVSFKPIHG